MYFELTVSAVFASTFAFYEKGDVVELTPSNFDRLVIQSDEIWVVEFYASWCGHCQQLVPEYTKLATALKGIAKVGAVNADEHRSIGGQYGVKGNKFISWKKIPSKARNMLTTLNLLS